MKQPTTFHTTALWVLSIGVATSAGRKAESMEKHCPYCSAIATITPSAALGNILSPFVVKQEHEPGLGPLHELASDTTVSVGTANPSGIALGCSANAAVNIAAIEKSSQTESSAVEMSTQGKNGRAEGANCGEATLGNGDLDSRNPRGIGPDERMRSSRRLFWPGIRQATQQSSSGTEESHPHAIYHEESAKTAPLSTVTASVPGDGGGISGTSVGGSPPPLSSSYLDSEQSPVPVQAPIVSPVGPMQPADCHTQCTPEDYRLPESSGIVEHIPQGDRKSAGTFAPSPPARELQREGGDHWSGQTSCAGAHDAALGLVASQMRQGGFDVVDAPPASNLGRLVASVLPEILRAVKFVAAASLLIGVMRRISFAPRPKIVEGWRGSVPATLGREGGTNGLRRAREALMTQALGMRVPVDVIASLDSCELEVASDLVDCDNLDVTFEDIAGMDGVKDALQEIISEPLDLPPDMYPARLIKPCSGILIYGPPGCGKTLLAQAVAKQSGAAFISVKASTLMCRAARTGGAGNLSSGGASKRGTGSGDNGGGVGHSSVLVRALFTLAQKIQPCIIFFDEADGLCFRREEGDAGPDRAVMTELMQLWDEVSNSGRDRVIVLAATNRPWDLDPAVQVGLPDRKMRKAVLMKALEDVEVEEGFDWRELAVNTEGYSCGDVVELCREAVRGPLREAMERNRRRAARRISYRAQQARPQLEQQRQRRRKHARGHQRRWQTDYDANLLGSEMTAAAAVSAEADRLPPVRMRPLRMSDVTTAQQRVVPAFWQSEAYRATYDGYMESLMEHARQNWSR